MSVEERRQKARELFLAGANCSQAVLGAYAEDCQMTLQQAYRMASGFGGGISRLREVCGAVSGMVMVANILWGPDTVVDKAAKDAHYAHIRRLTDAFRQEAGSIICRELLGLSPRQSDSPVSEARTAEYYKKRSCMEMVMLAVAILEKERQSKKECER